MRRIYPMMEFDFQRWERPDERDIHTAMMRGGAELLLFKDENGLECGYALMLRDKPLGHALLGWFAVYPTQRGGGIGGEFLSLIKEYYRDWLGILLEVTEYPALEKARKLVSFYARNGWREVECVYKISGRDTAIMWLPIKGEQGVGKGIDVLMREVYKGLYPGRRFDKYMEVIDRYGAE